MATNEKTAYATSYTTHGGKLFRPGEQLTGRVAPDVIRQATEGGLTTTSHADAERAKSAEADRQRQVAEQIATRSERREPEERADIRH